MPDTPWRVVVIGGGIGGLALAQALHAGGIDVQVHERDPEPSGWLQRYRININPQGARALHRCLPEPLWNAFVATSAPPGDLTFRTERLAELLTLRRGHLLNSADPADGQYGVSRVVLRNLLLAGLNDVVHFGARFERFEVGDDGLVTAHFANGSTATGDVLVGADGRTPGCGRSTCRTPSGSRSTGRTSPAGFRSPRRPGRGCRRTWPAA